MADKAGRAGASIEAVRREVRAEFEEDDGNAQEVILRVQARSGSEQDVYEAHVGFWLALFEATARAPVDGWDFVYIDLRDADEGALHGFVATWNTPFAYPERPDDEESDHFVVDWSCSVEAEVPYPDPCAELDEDDESYDALSGELLEADVRARAASLAAAAEDPRLRPLISQWQSREGFGAFWCCHPHGNYEVLLSPLFGAAAPGPPRPTTVLAAWSRLFQRMQLAVYQESDSFAWKGDRLVGIELTGHEATDAVLALLDPIEDLAALCADLQTITLDTTLITDAAIAKLQQRLPHVKIERSD